MYNTDNNLWLFAEVSNILLSSINQLKSCKSKLEQLEVIARLIQHACVWTSKNSFLEYPRHCKPNQKISNWADNEKNYILVLAETFLKPHHKINFRQFIVHRNDRENKAHRGVAIIIVTQSHTNFAPLQHAVYWKYCSRNNN